MALSHKQILDSIEWSDDPIMGPSMIHMQFVNKLESARSDLWCAEQDVWRYEQNAGSAAVYSTLCEYVSAIEESIKRIEDVHFDNCPADTCKRERAEYESAMAEYAAQLDA